MRIETNSPPREVDKKSKKTPASVADNAGRSPFADALRRLNEEEVAAYNLELTRLKQEIDRAGDDLDREPTIAHFKKFRDLLSALGRKVTSEAYRVDKVKSSGITPHEHEIITVIDREADELYRLVISEQKDRLAITEKIMRIKGLVLDFAV